MKKNRFIRRANGSDVDALKVGLVCFLQKVIEQGDGVIVVPKYEHLDFSILHDLLVETFGEDFANRFLKDKKIGFTDGRFVHLCSNASLKNHSYGKVYLVLWGGNSIVDAIEGLHNWESLIWVTWTPSEGDEWQVKHNPDII